MASSHYSYCNYCSMGGISKLGRLISRHSGASRNLESTDAAGLRLAPQRRGVAQLKKKRCTRPFNPVDIRSKRGKISPVVPGFDPAREV